MTIPLHASLPTTATSACADEVLLLRVVQDLPMAKRQWLRAQYRLRLFVESPEFIYAFMILILANTIALALIWDNQSQT